MDHSEILSLLRREIRREINIILSGQAGTNTQFVETIENMLGGMPNIKDRPVMHPYGFVSRAPRGTISVVGRQGEHFGNRIILGHRDGNRPSLEEGETILYNQFGRAVKVLTNKILIGDDDSTENVVLGQVFKTMMSTVLEALAVHLHVGNLGYYTGVPNNADVYSDQKASPVDDEAILSDESFARKG